MKRLLALLLILTLLAGCVANVPSEPTQATEPSVDPPTELPAPTLHAPDSAVEQQTNGTVRSYPLNAYCDGMILMGDRVILYYLGEQMTVKAYSGDDLALDMVTTYHIAIPANANGVQTTQQEIFYFDPVTNTVVILNAQLREKHRVELPDGIQGSPVVNRAMDTVYYCTAEGIRSLDLNTGIAHMLRRQENYSGILMGACFDGDLLMCATTQQDGTMAMEFISTQTGLQIDKDPALRWIKTLEDQFFLMRYEGGEQYLFGQRTQEERFEYLIPEGNAVTLAALELGGVLRIVQQEKALFVKLLCRCICGFNVKQYIGYAVFIGIRFGNLQKFCADPTVSIFFPHAEIIQISKRHLLTLEFNRNVTNNGIGEFGNDHAILGIGKKPVEIIAFVTNDVFFLIY